MRSHIKQRCSIIVALALGLVACSTRASPTRPERIATVEDAQQAMDYLAVSVESEDMQSTVDMFTPNRGDPLDNAAVLIAYREDAAAWLRTRKLVAETDEYYVFELTESGVFRTHQLRVYKYSTDRKGGSNEGIDL